jgi:hypothetical protein
MESRANEGTGAGNSVSETEAWRQRYRFFHPSRSARRNHRVDQLLRKPQQRSDYVCSIIFVHGLQGHPRKTWTCENVPRLGSQGSRETTEGSHRGIRKIFSRKRKEGLGKGHKLEASEVFWPFDLLPADCGNARILTWGYDSKVSHFFNGTANQSNITAHARNLLHALKVRRLNCVSLSRHRCGMVLSYL